MRKVQQDGSGRIVDNLDRTRCGHGVASVAVGLNYHAHFSTEDHSAKQHLFTYVCNGSLPGIRQFALLFQDSRRVLALLRRTLTRPADDKLNMPRRKQRHQRGTLASPAGAEASQGSYKPAIKASWLLTVPAEILGHSIFGHWYSLESRRLDIKCIQLLPRISPNTHEYDCQSTSKHLRLTTLGIVFGMCTTQIPKGGHNPTCCILQPLWN